jgi:hypothetical protein
MGNNRGVEMTRCRYHIGGMLELLSLLVVVLIMPTNASGEYLDGGYMGIPDDIYSRMDPSVTNNIIGTIHEKTLFGLSDEKPLQMDYRLKPDFDIQPRNRYGIFNETRSGSVFHFKPFSG